MFYEFHHFVFIVARNLCTCSYCTSQLTISCKIPCGNKWVWKGSTFSADILAVSVSYITKLHRIAYCWPKKVSFLLSPHRWIQSAAPVFCDQEVSGSYLRRVTYHGLDFAGFCLSLQASWMQPCSLTPFLVVRLSVGACNKIYLKRHQMNQE